MFGYAVREIVQIDREILPEKGSFRGRTSYSFVISVYLNNLNVAQTCDLSLSCRERNQTIKDIQYLFHAVNFNDRGQTFMGVSLKIFVIFYFYLTGRVL